MIMRVWRGITSREQGDAYLEHLRQTALPKLAEQAGQRGAWVMRRVQGDHCEFQLLTLWESLDSLRAFAGDQPERAIYFAEDDKFLLNMEPLVRLYDVMDQVQAPR